MMSNIHHRVPNIIINTYIATKYEIKTEEQLKVTQTDLVIMNILFNLAHFDKQI